MISAYLRELDIFVRFFPTNINDMPLPENHNHGDIIHYRSDYYFNVNSLEWKKLYALSMISSIDSSLELSISINDVHEICTIASGGTSFHSPIYSPPRSLSEYYRNNIINSPFLYNKQLYEDAIKRIEKITTDYQNIEELEPIDANEWEQLIAGETT